MMRLPMMMDFSLTSTQNLKNLSDHENKSQKLLTSDGAGRSFSEIDNTATVIDLECALENVDIQQKHNDTLLSRQKFQLTQLQSTHEALTQFRLDVSQARSSQNMSNGTFPASIDRTLSLLNTVMNDHFGNDVTLSGTAFYSNATVNLMGLDRMGMLEADQANTSYYLGGGHGDMVYIDSKSTIDRAEITGEDPCFEKMIRGLRLAKSIQLDSEDADEMYGKVMSLLEEASLDLSTAQARVGHTIEMVQGTTDGLRDLNLRLTESYKTEALTDQMENFESWQKIKTQLEISRSLVTYQAQENAQFIQKIFS
jgi:hypothetical protein